MPRSTLAFLLLLACALSPVRSAGAESRARKKASPPPHATYPIWFVSNGFHSGVAIRLKDAGPILRGATSMPGTKTLLLGWGERTFYTTGKMTPASFVKYVCWPSESALHVIPLASEPQNAMQRCDVIRFEVDFAELQRYRDHLERQFATRADGKPIRLGPGYSQKSEFYSGRARFYFPKMCNLWCAEALGKAGVRLAWPLSIAAQTLVWQAEGSGKKVGRRSRPREGF